MPVTVKVNGTANSLVHKGSNGISIATMPDVCKTPSPGGPVPLPYPNISQSVTLAKGTTTVKADGGMMIANQGSEFSLSNGDNAGVAGGVTSSTFMKESTWILYSFDVKMQGKGAARLTDKKFQNHQNTVDAAGTVQTPTPLLLWEKDYLCMIFCACLLQHKYHKTEVGMSESEMVDLEKFGAKQPPAAGRCERQGCVEKELREANNSLFEPEMEYFVNGKKRRPDVSVFDSTGKLTSLVEMKFPGDTWQKDQKSDYKRIAKRHNATLKLLDAKNCNCPRESEYGK